MELNSVPTSLLAQVREALAGRTLFGLVNNAGSSTRRRLPHVALTLNEVMSFGKFGRCLSGL